MAGPTDMSSSEVLPGMTIDSTFSRKRCCTRRRKAFSCSAWEGRSREVGAVVGGLVTSSLERATNRA